MVWLSDGEIILKICLFVSTEYTNVTDTARRGGAADFKGGGTKQDSQAERATFFWLYPHFSKCGGTSKQISVRAY